MDYEKKYNEALEKAKYYHDRDNIQFLENIFPELKESEDERIRKEILTAFSCGHDNSDIYGHGITYGQVRAWLEKQGEHSVSPLFTFDDVLTIQCAMAYAKFQDRELDVALKKLHDKVYDAYHDSKNHNIESQDGLKGEQIPANIAKTCKDEQKPNPYSGTSFDYDGHTWGMCARDNGVELLLDGELKAFLSLEKSFIYPIHSQSELAPKSALEAAKEEKVDNANKVEPKDYNDIDPHFGKPIDKVVPKFNVDDWIIDNNIKTPFQITGISNEKYDVISIYGTDMAFSSREVEYFYHLWTINDAKDGDVLATDDWVFIFEKVNDDKTIHCYCHYDYDEDMQAFNVDTDYHMVTGGTINPATKEQRDLLFQKMHEEGYEWDAEKKEMKKIEQKPAWSEVDNFMYNKIKNLLTDISLAPEAINSLSDWLKDLKDRVQPQTTWKPSREQIMALRWVLNHIPYDSHKEEISGLLEQLKKLREE